MYLCGQIHTCEMMFMLPVELRVAVFQDARLLKAAFQWKHSWIIMENVQKVQIRDFWADS